MIKFKHLLIPVGIIALLLLPRCIDSNVKNAMVYYDRPAASDLESQQ